MLQNYTAFKIEHLWHMFTYKALWGLKFKVFFDKFYDWSNFFVFFDSPLFLFHDWSISSSFQKNVNWNNKNKVNSFIPIVVEIRYVVATELFRCMGDKLRKLTFVFIGFTWPFCYVCWTAGFWWDTFWWNLCSIDIDTIPRINRSARRVRHNAFRGRFGKVRKVISVYVEFITYPFMSSRKQ